MRDKEFAKEMFMTGFIAARKGAFTSNELGPVTQRTAENLFERWWDRNRPDEEIEGMGCPTCEAGPDQITEDYGVTVCPSCGCLLVDSND